MRLTLIITTYNRPESLMLVMKSIENQTISPYEVIIADDGSNKETRGVITNFNDNSELNIIHSWQKDIGFRVSRSSNNAISKSSGDYVVLIDGDLILHTNFIEDHIKNATLGYFVQGSRVFLSEKQTKNAINRKNIYFSFFSPGLSNRKNSIHSFFLSKVFSNKKNNLNGIKSCNMAFYLKDCLKINGFNNEFEGWGREDSEFIVRLMNSGIKRKNIRFNAIQFHLYHEEHSRKSLVSNDLILSNSIKNNSQWCNDGLNSVEAYES